jgi:hypothetical protein
MGTDMWLIASWYQLRRSVHKKIPNASFLILSVSSRQKRFMFHVCQTKHLSYLNQSFPEPFILVIAVWPFKSRVKSHLPFTSVIRRINIYGSVHCKYILVYVYIQQDATLHSLFISGNCSTRFGWYFHPSSGAHTTVSTASGICHTFTAICRYRGRTGTGLSVLWVA